jgi:hypothetical protein
MDTYTFILSVSSTFMEFILSVMYILVSKLSVEKDVFAVIYATLIFVEMVQSIIYYFVRSKVYDLAKATKKRMKSENSVEIESDSSSSCSSEVEDEGDISEDTINNTIEEGIELTTLHINKNPLHERE